MAQHWLEITSDYDPEEWSHVLGPAGSPGRDLTVVDDSGVPALRWGNTGTGRIQYHWDVVDVAEDFEIFCLSRTDDAGSSSANAPGLGGRMSSSLINGYIASYRVAGRLFSTRWQNDSQTVLNTSSIGNGVSNPEAYHWMGVAAGGSAIKYFSWDGAITDRPVTPRYSTTDTTLTGAGPVGLMATAVTQPGYARIVTVGTDGDPAPTGPVDVSAEAFTLRHNPRTNKVIPVLSSPTVTDIGAACVRPRVTKGY